MTTGYDAYHHNSVATASPEQLVVMLFDGALRFARRAASAYERNDPATATSAIGRVGAIVAELNATLDMEVGGEVAENLRNIYTFASRHLIDAATERDPQRVRDVINLLTPLREAFSEAAKGVRAA